MYTVASLGFAASSRELANQNLCNTVFQYFSAIVILCRTYSSCDKGLTYCGETCRHLSVRVGKHSGVSPLTEKNAKSEKSTALKDHMLFCDHIASIDDFKYLATSDSDSHVKVKESLLILRDVSTLNKNETSLPLYLFD